MTNSSSSETCLGFSGHMILLCTVHSRLLVTPEMGTSHIEVAINPILPVEGNQGPLLHQVTVPVLQSRSELKTLCLKTVRNSLKWFTSQQWIFKGCQPSYADRCVHKEFLVVAYRCLHLPQIIRVFNGLANKIIKKYIRRSTVQCKINQITIRKQEDEPCFGFQQSFYFIVITVEVGEKKKEKMDL
ncbi:hypothetical protein IEQ34_014013 [Dendrobium chrysotoxum]|uniref:Uncharacterized protein n=1 Tax=Dendrobium chrysotoxum TaxID=161865 RepID=A0AAV7GHS4_DENCH|nr:hypothetical protein IEQ34_014013 [Dendrobium chrysotoxum]